MSIRIKCPQCQGVMEAEEKLLGARARCPFCHTIVTVEKAPAEPEPVARPAAPTVGPVPRAAENGRKEERGGASPDDPTLRPPPLYSVTLLPPEPPIPASPARDKAIPKTVMPAEITNVQGPVGLVLGTQERRRKRSRFVALFRSLRHGNPTDASMLVTAGGGILLTALLYLVVQGIGPIRTSHVGQLLTQRTWVVHFTVYLTIWAGMIILVKFWKLADQQAALTYDVLPPDPSVRIRPSNIGMIEAHIKKLPVVPRQNILVNRVLLALNHFKARKNVAEVGGVLTAQAEIDAAMVDSSYTMLKVLIWGIPILGFIGTVIGISAAVSGFTGSVQSAKEIDEVRGALGSVTEGLAVAFDTTFIGLVLSIVVMFPTHSLQKAEDDLLTAVDQYCNENLMSRLDPDEAVPASQPEESSTLQSALQAQQATLEQWQRRLENLETALLERVMDTLAEVRNELGNKESRLQEDAAD